MRDFKKKRRELMTKLISGLEGLGGQHFFGCMIGCSYVVLQYNLSFLGELKIQRYR